MSRFTKERCEWRAENARDRATAAREAAATMRADAAGRSGDEQRIELGWARAFDIHAEADERLVDLYERLARGESIE